MDWPYRNMTSSELCKNDAKMIQYSLLQSKIKTLILLYNIACEANVKWVAGKCSLCLPASSAGDIYNLAIHKPQSADFLWLKWILAQKKTQASDVFKKQKQAVWKSNLFEN